jgi:hypothetical protein
MGVGGRHQLFGRVGVGQVRMNGVGAPAVGLHCAHDLCCGYFVDALAELGPLLGDESVRPNVSE